MLSAELRNSFGKYYLAVNPGFEWADYQQLKIVPALEAVERGETTRLMIWQHPGSAKSDLATRAFVPWYLGRHPDRNVAVLSYSADLASDDFGARIKARMQGDVHMAVFPNSRITHDSSSKTHLTTIKGGNFYSMGVQGGITGRRLDLCFSGNTRVQTEIGLVEIAQLHLMKTPPRVLGYDHNCGQLKWCKIQKSRESLSDDIIELRTADGKRITCTGDHRIYTDQFGYRAARFLRPGDGLVAYPFKEKQGLRDLRKTETRPWTELLSNRFPELRVLWNPLQEGARRIREAPEAWAAVFLLWARARICSLWGKISRNEMCFLSGLGEIGADVLFAEMSECVAAGSGPKNYMPTVWSGVPSQESTEHILQRTVRKSSTLDSDARLRKLALQNGNQLREAVQGHAGFYPFAGLGTMRNVWWREESSCSSHRRESDEQRTAQSDYALPGLPPDSSQIETDSVAVVRHLRAGRVPVYDIQVEGTNNFFAEGILVHNCILDDLIKSEEEADSELVQARLFTAYTSEIKDRLKPGGALVICNHRWRIRDISGRILELEGREENGGEWKVLQLKAEDPPGHYLWEDHYGKKHYESFKKNEDIWNSKWQQDPQASAELWFREEWLNYYDIPIPPGKFNTYMFVDPAAAKGKHTDRTVVLVFAAGPEQRLFLVDAVWDRLDPGERVEAILRLARRWQIQLLIYEEYGLLNDTYYLNEKMTDQGFSVYPIPVGKSGPRHNLTKDARIKAIQPLFREGKIFLPRKMNRTLCTGKKIDLIERFIEDEYKLYKGQGSIKHEDFLDCMSRVLEPEALAAYSYAVVEEEDSRPSVALTPGLSWESVY